MTKLRIFIDLDGVLADFALLASAHPNFTGDGHCPDLDLDFSILQPIPGAKLAVQALLDSGHDLLIASTAPWDNPNAWTQKRLWVADHFPQFRKKLILTHRKDLLIGDILIDDHTWNGAGDFSGKLIHFGTDQFPDWTSVVDHVNILATN